MFTLAGVPFPLSKTFSSSLAENYPDLELGTNTDGSGDKDLGRVVGSWFSIRGGRMPSHSVIHIWYFLTRLDFWVWLGEGNVAPKLWLRLGDMVVEWQTVCIKMNVYIFQKLRRVLLTKFL